MRRLPLAVSTTVALLAVAIPAGAPPASAQTLSSGHTAVVLRAPQFTADAGAVVSWSWQDGLGNGATTGASMVARRAGAAAFGAQRALPDGLVLGPAAYGSGRLVVATQRDTRTSSTLRVRFGDLDGSFGAARLIARRPHIRAAQLAVNARGDAALGWSENFGSRRDRVYVSLRRRGGGFAPPTELGRGPVRAMSVAVGPAGDVLAAWDARGRIRTRYLARSEHAFGAVDELRSQTTYAAALQTAIAADGRAWVAWTSQLLTEGGGSGDAYVQAAMRAPGGRRFHRALLLEHAPDWAIPAPVSLAIDVGGEAALAWAIWDGGPARQPAFTTVSSARIDRAGRPRTTVLARFAEVEPSSAPQIALRDDGAALATWTQTTAGAGAVYAALQPPGGAWGAPAGLGAGSSALAAYPPGDGAPLVVLHGSGPAGALLQTVAPPPG